MAKKTKELIPLRQFDYKLVAAQLEGFLFNVDRALEKQDRWAFSNGDSDLGRQLGLLMVLLRIAKNSYSAVLYLTATEPPNVSRKDTYTLIIPPVNRQLLDLLFSLVYMMEKFAPRSLEYQKSGWREQIEERNTLLSEFAKDPRYHDYFMKTEESIKRAEQLFGISHEEKTKIGMVPYWPTPTQLVDRAGDSRQFRRYLEKWIYRDVSSQAHLGFAGVQKMAVFLFSDLMSKDTEAENLRKCGMHTYHFQQVSRSAILTLAIATEVDTFRKLGHQNQANFLWVLFGEYVVEAQEMWDKRYKNRPKYPET